MTTGSVPRKPQTQAQNTQDILARLESIEQTQALLMEQLNAIAKNINGTNIKDMNVSITRIRDIIDGDESKDIVGLRKRTRITEQLVEQLAEERNKVRWILIGVSLSGIANLTTLISLLAKALGGM